MAIKFSAERWREMEALLDAVLDQPIDQQLTYLRQRCDGDIALFNDIKELLRAQSDAPSILNAPAANLLATFLSRELSHVEHAELSGKLIGPYQLCEVLGRGGMGIVYRAERRQGGFAQEVAIKLLSTVSERSAIRDRFAREQQTLAALSHHNIARLLDGGVTENGQPYLVMEYVIGIPVDRYCDKHGLSVEHRLHLLEQVMSALAYAHQHLIVHRDIKPSNVLVSSEGQVKLLDFGVAKLLGENADLALTRTGDQVLTPGYASPEQLQNKPISVATDIYQLGLLIYEILTGHCAYRDQADSVMSLMQQVCEHEPTLPSHIVMQALRDFSLPDDAPQKQLAPEQRAALRGCTPYQLHNILKGDIDAIVLHTLSNAPENRYRSIEALQADLSAYWSSRPIAARQLVWSYQLRKFLRRNWRIAAVASTFFVVLLSYAITVTRQSQQIQLALDQSTLQQRKTQQVSDFLVTIFKAADPNVAGLETLSAQALLEKGEQRIGQELESAPEIKGAMLTLLGEIYFSQGLAEKSTALMTQALQKQRSAGDANRLGLADTLTQLASVYRYQGQLEQATPLYQESIALHQQLLRESGRPGSAEYAETLAAYGELLQLQGDYVQAESHLRQAISMFELVTLSGHEELPNALNNLATLQHLQGRHQDARNNFQRALTLQEKILGAEHSYFTVYLANFGMALTDMEYYDEASDKITRALTLQRKILKPDHFYIANSLRALGVLQYRQGNFAEAEKTLREEMAFHEANGSRRSLAGGLALLWLGTVLQESEQLDHAEQIYAEMENIFREKKANNEMVGRGMSQMALLAYQRGQTDKADALFTQALSLMPAAGMRTSLVQMSYAATLIDRDRFDDAAPLVQKVLSERQHKFPPQNSLLAEVNAAQALLLHHEGQTATSRVLLQTAIPVLEKQALFQASLRARLLKRAREIVTSTR